MSAAHDHALAVFRDTPGEPLTAREVADGMVSRGHDFGAPGATPTARVALTAAILRRLTLPGQGPLQAADSLDNEPRWRMPLPSSTMPPQTESHATAPEAAAAREAVRARSAPAPVGRLTPAATRPRKTGSRPAPDRAQIATTIALLVVATALLVIAVT